MYKTLTPAASTDFSKPILAATFDGGTQLYKSTLTVAGATGTAVISSVTIDGAAVAVGSPKLNQSGSVQTALATSAGTKDYIQCDIQASWVAATNTFEITFIGEAQVTSLTIGGTPTAVTVTAI
jgi:hypothetical protein